MSQSQIDNCGAGRGSQKSYAAGFFLSVLLTVIPFALVMNGALSRVLVLFGICGSAIVQILVHLHYFLHLDTTSAKRWNLLALVFAVLIMTLFVGGTLWIMYHLRHRMMY